MLGLILLYWIGKYFYKLAEEYDKSKWGFAILGVVVYYSGILLFGILVGIYYGLFLPEELETLNETLIGLISIPFGILSCYLLYKYLEKKWKKNSPLENDLIDQIGKRQE